MTDMESWEGTKRLIEQINTVFQTVATLLATTRYLQLHCQLLESRIAELEGITNPRITAQFIARVQDRVDEKMHKALAGLTRPVDLDMGYALVEQTVHDVFEELYPDYRRRLQEAKAATGSKSGSV